MQITFKKGIPGFEEHKEFKMYQIENNDKLKMMVSKEDSNIGFIVISPFEVEKEYEIYLDDETINTLDIKNPKEVLILNLITLGKTLETSTVNLKAPLIININNNKGKQLILQDDKYKIKQPLKWSDKNVGDY